jgi:hypothetical protein
MSLSIDTEKLVAVYALGEWHQIEIGSVDIDAFELMHYPDSPEARARCAADRSTNRGDRISFYAMGALYHASEPEHQSSWMNEGSRERMQTMETPSGSAGFCFRTPQGFRKAFSLMECKGFEYQCK